MRKIYVYVILLTLVVNLVSAPINTAVVNKTGSTACAVGDQYYSTIQSAIDAVAVSGTVIVCDDTAGGRNESVNISTSGITIKGNQSNTQINGLDLSGNIIFNISANNVNIHNFTINASTFNGETQQGSGISVSVDFTGTTISYNNFTMNQVAIILTDANYTNITNNDFGEGTCLGALGLSSSGSTFSYHTYLTNNIFIGNGSCDLGGMEIGHGIDLSSLLNTTLINNTFHDFNAGIYDNPDAAEIVSQFDIIYNNTLYNNTYAFYLNGTNYTILQNKIEWNTVGIQLEHSSSNITHDLNNYTGNVYIFNISNTTNFLTTGGLFSYLDYGFVIRVKQGGVIVNQSAQPSSDPPGYASIGAFLNITNTSYANVSEITFQYTDASLAAAGITDETTMVIYKYSGGAWRLMNGTVMAPINAVQITNIDSFSIFAPMGVLASSSYPNLTLEVPTNTTYNITNITLNYSQSGAEVCFYTIDGGAKTNVPGCVNTSFITTVGQHTLGMYANDSSGNTNETANVSFVVDIPPVVTLDFPTNTSYNYTNLGLNFSVSDNESCW